MTEVIRNSLINEKPKPKLLHRFKFIQRYFSYSTLQQKHLDKSSKSISTQSNSIKVKPINDDPFHLHNMTSPKLLNSRRNTNHWTMKQFKKRIQATHNNHKHKQKSATLSVEPTRDQMTSQMHHHHLYTTQYHTLKDTTSVVYTNGKDNFDTLDEIHLNNSRTMDDVSLQSISMSSLSLDDYNNDNDKADIQITNLDEVELHHRINDEKITPSNFVNEILKESGLDKSWFTVDHKMDDDDDEDEDRRQARKESLNDSTTPLNGQLSMSDIYSIFTSHEQLDHYNKSFIEMNNNTSSISSNLLNVNKHKAKSNMITSLLKSNLYSKGIQLKQYLNIPTKCKTLPTMETHLSSSEKSKSN
ncbi:hypothetical protein Smp_160370 [Schistosoma mansoni]|uniref:hypothetical protein n=1 Tax=Schistosoma mansoni TaxID=6183 RepID=UPI0001A62721|nr:hypothetical protein Smp_160370 [Schistosoma mansoni]|eukprot:XP_018646438.1 hypothetical protein Smp_160370 [Schistosoma mansoni]